MDEPVLVTRATLESFAQSLLTSRACINGQSRTSEWLAKIYDEPASAAVISFHAWCDFLTIFCYEHAAVLLVDVAEIRLAGRAWYLKQKTTSSWQQPVQQEGQVAQ